jgi:hypothetical protein
LREYFLLFDREALLMSSFETPADLPIAPSGGVRSSAISDEDRYHALDDLMAAVEALCPTWPAGKVDAPMDTMRL